MPTHERTGFRRIYGPGKHVYILEQKMQSFGRTDPSNKIHMFITIDDERLSSVQLTIGKQG